MSFKPSPYQTQFRKGLAGDYAATFDEVTKMAGGAKTLADFVKQLPEDFHKFLENAKTVDQAVEVVFSNSDWGTASYAAPKVAAPAKVRPVAAPKAVAVAVAPPAGTTAPKRRGNPEALKKAREARGLKNPEQIAADRLTVINATATYLQSNPGDQLVKPLVLALVEQLKGQGSDTKDLTESFIYSTITEAAKAESCVFVAKDMEGRKRGYAIR